MRIIVLSLFATLALMVAASAAPELVTDTIITDNGNSSKPKVLARSQTRTENGKQAVMQIDWIRYAVTATLTPKGRVNVAAVFTRLPYGRRGRTIVFPIRTAALGETLEGSAGTLFFSTKTSLAK